MYDIIRNIIGYTGQSNVDNTIFNICAGVIPMLIAFFIWQFTKLISYIVNYGKK